MRKFIQNKLKEQKGLTLIELLAVIVILAIIAAIAIPAIGNIINNSRVGAIKSDAQNIISAAELYYTDNPSAAEVTALSTLTSNGYLDNAGSFAETGATFTKITKASGATPSTLSAKGKIGDIEITFTDATRTHIKSLSNSAANGAKVTETSDRVVLKR